MEHAWMMTSVDGSCDAIMHFLSSDPGLTSRRDFISGFSVLHWLAKSGRDEVLLRVLQLCQDAGVQVSVEGRGSGGLTPLHLASMHGRYCVIKVLVGAFSANPDVMDYNGKRAWQYLSPEAPQEIKELLGTWDDLHTAGGGGATGGGGGATGGDTGGSEVVTPQEDEAPEMTFNRTRRAGSWRPSLKKLMKSLR